MSKIRILLTSAGGLVSPGIINLLRDADDFYIVGTDMNNDAIGFEFTDSSYTVPAGNDKDYISYILDICKKEKIQVIVPCSDEENLSLAYSKDLFEKEGIKILCSSYESVSISSDKGKMLSFLNEQCIEVPKYSIPQNIKELKEALINMGYPKKKLIVKPSKGRGGRGVRILNCNANILEGRGIQEITSEHMIDAIEKQDSFPKIIVMEHLPGEDYSVDVLANKGQSLFVVPRKRIKSIGGPSQVGEIVNNLEIKEMVTRIVEKFGFENNINIQLKYSIDNKPLVYEINPRVSGTIAANWAAGANLLYLGIRKVLGLEIPKEISIIETKMIRYLKEYYKYGDKQFKA